MWKKKLIKNKVYAIMLLALGALTVPIEWDTTFFLFASIVGLALFFSKENCIY